VKAAVYFESGDIRKEMTSKFTQKILNWAKLHPDDPDSAFILESYAGFLQKKKEESKRWYLIASELLRRF